MRRPLPALLALAALGACHGTIVKDSPWLVPSAGGALVDAKGRTVILRGVNARIDGLFDVTFDDGRTALEPIPAFDDSDMAYLAQNGATVLRVPVNWSGLEPHSGALSSDYLARLDQIVGLCRGHAVACLLDMHQDAWSKEIGEDGAPLWAIIPAPTQLLQGPLTDLDQRRVSSQVLDAFASFFSDAQGVQEAYAGTFSKLAARYAGEPAVLGYELMNEPVAFDDVKLSRFHQKLAQALSAVAPNQLLLFEPDATRNATDAAPLSKMKFPVANGVYAPHVYTDVFSGSHDSWASQDPARLAPSVTAARAEADSWGTPLFVTEFGIDPTLAQAPAYIAAELDNFDRVGASATFWLYKEESQGDWGLFDAGAGGTWTERGAAANALFRPYAHRIPGRIASSSWDAASRTLTVAFDGEAPDPDHQVIGPPEIAAPARWYPGGVAFTCDGAAAKVLAQRDAIYTVSCGEGSPVRHTLTAGPP